ncbi:MAG: hypothetical protein AAF762_08360 [Pseudomonadota bacterium]
MRIAGIAAIAIATYFVALRAENTPFVPGRIGPGSADCTVVSRFLTGCGGGLKIERNSTTSAPAEAVEISEKVDAVGEHLTANAIE